MRTAARDRGNFVADLDGRSEFLTKPYGATRRVVDHECAVARNYGAAGHLFDGPSAEIAGEIIAGNFTGRDTSGGREDHADEE